MYPLFLDDDDDDGFHRKEERRGFSWRNLGNEGAHVQMTPIIISTSLLETLVFHFGKPTERDGTHVVIDMGHTILSTSSVFVNSMR